MDNKKILLTTLFSLLLLSNNWNPFLGTNSNGALAVTEPVKISVDRGSETWQLPDGQFVFKTGDKTATNTFDSSTGQWKPYVIHDLGAGNYEVQSGLIATRFNSADPTCTIKHFDANMTQQAMCEKVMLMKKQGSNYIEVAKTLQSRNIATEQKIIQKTIAGYSVSDVVNTVNVTETYSTDSATVSVIYTFRDGLPLKHTVVTLPSVTDTFALYIEFTSEVDKYVLPNGNTQNIPAIDLTVSKNTLETFLQSLSSRPMIQFKQGDVFKFAEIIAPSTTDPSWQRFKELHINTQSQPTMVLQFRYGDWSATAGIPFVLDPDIFTNTNATPDNQIHDSDNDDNCETSPATVGSTLDGALTGLVGRYGSGATNDCARVYYQYSLSGIQNTAVITDVDWDAEITAVSTPSNCDVVGLVTNQPATRTNAELWSDINSGTSYISNNSFCTTTGTKPLDLGETAVSDVQTKITGGDWYGLAVLANGDIGAIDATTRQSTHAFEENNPRPTLTIVYTVPTYTLTKLSVYESSTRALNDGTAICTNISLTGASSCTGDLVQGRTYQFQVNVTNTGGQAGSPTSSEFRDVVANNDVLGTIDASVLDTGCNDDGTDRTWTDSISTDDAVGTSGTTCSIEATTGWEIYYFIATIDTDANDGTGTFFVTDGTINDVSTTTTFTVVPPPPTNVIPKTLNTTSINATWSSSGIVNGFKIERESPVGGGFSILVANTTTTTTFYVNNGLTAGTQYNYRISTHNTAGTSSASTANNNYTITNAPTSLSATAPSASQIDLSWIAPSGTVNGYKIERESPIGGGFSTIVANTTTTAVTYSNTGLSDTTQYNYRISAHNKGGTSSASNTDSATTLGSGGSPPPPSGGGGGGGGAGTPIVTTGSGLTGLTLLANKYSPSLGDVINDTIKVKWLSRADILVKDIKVGEFRDWIGFKATPLLLRGNPEIIEGVENSEGTIPFKLVIPENRCADEQLIRCVEEKTYEIPVTVTLEFNNIDYTSHVIIIVDFASKLNFATIQTILIATLIIGSVIGGGVFRAHKSRTKGNKNFLKKLKKMKVD